jgi:hypothetical protein
VAVLRVARRQRAPRAERLEVGQLETETAEIELHVLRQRRVSRGEDEAVAAEPVRVRGIVAQDPLVQQVRGRREAHRRAGVSVAHLLHGIRGQHASGVHRAPIDLIPTSSDTGALSREECVRGSGGGAAVPALGDACGFSLASARSPRPCDATARHGCR